MAPRHVCDGLTHLAGRLDQIVRTWNVVDSGPPSPDQIERLYRAQHLDQALHLLRAQISVEYASELEAAVVGPLRRFQALEFRACQILNGDETGTTTTRRRHAVRSYLADRYRYWRGRVGSRDQVVDPTFDEIEEGFDQIRIEFEAAVRYLQNAAEAIRTLAAKPHQDQPVETGPPEFLPASKILQVIPDRFKDLNDLRRFCEKHDIEMRKPSAQKREIHVSGLIAKLTADEPENEELIGIVERYAKIKEEKDRQRKV